MKRILLTPGPGNLNPELIGATPFFDIGTREPRFKELWQSVATTLRRVGELPGDTEIIPFAGSGTLGAEAAIASLVHGRAVLATNGVYGDRLGEILTHYGFNLSTVKSPLFARTDEENVLQALHRHNPEYFIFVHHETSSGILNELPRALALCRENGIVVICDVVSSFAIRPIPLVDCYLFSSNKGLEAAAGLAFVAARPAYLARVAPRGRAYYSDLARQRRGAQVGEFPFTISPPLLQITQRALALWEREGRQNRFARYRTNGERIYTGLSALNFRSPVEANDQAMIVSSFFKPENFGDFQRWLYRNEIVIYGGSTAETFRVGVIGSIDASDIARFLEVAARFPGAN